MAEFFQYLAEFLKAFFIDLGDFFYDWIVFKWTKVGDNFSNYNQIFQQYSANWGVGGWIFFVIWWIIVAGLFFGLGFLIYWLLKKYIKFYKREIEKDKLENEVANLNNELYNAVQERDKILNLKVGELGVKPNGQPALDNKSAETLKEVQSRFPKLTYVDSQYKDKDVSIPTIEGLSLEELCQGFRLFCASQMHLYYKIETIRQLFAGMATSKLIILEGISGTGKTSLPYALGKYFKNDAFICSIQPSYKDRSELLGYYNEFTKKFNETEFLRALYETTYRKDLNIIVLDEMNLARVEYYFAEFLSIMEMPDVKEWNVELINTYSDTDPKNITKGKILIPQNVMFFGTANNDDSTFTISDKVYDRAISIFFDNKGIPFKAEYTEARSVSYEQIEKLYQDAILQFPISSKVLDKFNELDNFVIAKFRLAFGNRILKQLNTFIPVYVACGGTELDGFDFIFTNKVLKKFESLNVGFLKDELHQLNTELDKLFGKNNFKMAHAYIDNLIRMN
jgi:hypothetical protein